jgi:hypothetical protein
MRAAHAEHEGDGAIVGPAIDVRASAVDGHPGAPSSLHCAARRGRFSSGAVGGIGP